MITCWLTIDNKATLSHRVDGGGGIDTLKLEGAGLTLDLTKISDRRIQDIEVIDITGSGNNTLKLNLDDLLHTSASTNILKILGNSGDKVIVIDFDYLTTEKTVNGVTYSVTSPALETEWPLWSRVDSPLITKPRWATVNITSFWTQISALAPVLALLWV
jgi:uncharacterized UPF0146 family protein